MGAAIALLGNKESLAAELNNLSKKISMKFPAGRPIQVTNFLSTVMQAHDRNPALYECTAESRIMCIESAAILGFDFDPVKRLCYMVPFRNNKRNVTEAVFIIGYVGLIAAVTKTGRIRKVECELVYEYEPYQYGREKGVLILNHQPLPPDQRGKRMVAGYAVATMDDGTVQIEWVWADELEKIHQFSKGKDSPSWKEWPEEMHKKGPVRRLCKKIPQIAEDDYVRQALAFDNDSYQVQQVEAEVLQNGDKTRALAESLKGKKKQIQPPPATEPPAAGTEQTPPPKEGQSEQPAVDSAELTAFKQSIVALETSAAVRDFQENYNQYITDLAAKDREIVYAVLKGRSDYLVKQGK